MPYFESRLRLNLKNFEDVKNKFMICEKLGINNIIIEPLGEEKNIGVEFRAKLSSLTTMNVYYRLTFQPKTLEELKIKLKAKPNLPTILAIETPIKEIQIQAAKDSRVDIITFSESKIMKTLTPGVISLSKQNKSFIEISLSPIMTTNKALQSKNFRELYRILHLVKNSGQNLIINGNFDENYHIRHPRALISICHTLLDLSLIESKQAFSKVILKLLERAYDRYDRDYLENGIKFIKGGT